MKLNKRELFYIKMIKVLRDCLDKTGVELIVFGSGSRSDVGIEEAHDLLGEIELLKITYIDFFHINTNRIEKYYREEFFDNLSGHFHNEDITNRT